MTALLLAVPVAVVVALLAERTRLSRIGYAAAIAVTITGALTAELLAAGTGLGFGVPGFNAAMGAVLALALVPRSRDR